MKYKLCSLRLNALSGHVRSVAQYTGEIEKHVILNKTKKKKKHYTKPNNENHNLVRHITRMYVRMYVIYGFLNSYADILFVELLRFVARLTVSGTAGVSVLRRIATFCLNFILFQEWNT